jgi:hypothetical protein
VEAARRRRIRPRSILLILAVLVVLVGAGVYLGAGYLAYDELSTVQAHCGARVYASQTPADFTITGTQVSPLPDVGPSRFPDFTDVAFPTRGEG